MISPEMIAATEAEICGRLGWPFGCHHTVEPGGDVVFWGYLDADSGHTSYSCFSGLEEPVEMGRIYYR